MTFSPAYILLGVPLANWQLPCFWPKLLHSILHKVRQVVCSILVMGTGQHHGSKIITTEWKLAVRLNLYLLPLFVNHFNIHIKIHFKPKSLSWSKRWNHLRNRWSENRKVTTGEAFTAVWLGPPGTTQYNHNLNQAIPFWEWLLVLAVVQAVHVTLRTKICKCGHRKSCWPPGSLGGIREVWRGKLPVRLRWLVLMISKSHWN